MNNMGGDEEDDARKKAGSLRGEAYDDIVHSARRDLGYPRQVWSGPMVPQLIGKTALCFSKQNRLLKLWGSRAKLASLKKDKRASAEGYYQGNFPARYTARH